jgi:hypothetical protein
MKGFLPGNYDSSHYYLYFNSSAYFFVLKILNWAVNVKIKSYCYFFLQIIAYDLFLVAFCKSHQIFSK